MNDLPIIHPEMERLRDENRNLREEAGRLFTRLREMKDVVRPYLLALFQRDLGRWELEVLEARFEVAKLQRIIELVQASLNKGKIPDMDAVNKALGKEIKEWHIRIQETVNRIKASESSLANALSHKDGEELRALFRDLVMRLHPDLHKDLDDTAIGLWYLVLDAWKRSDLQEMRNLHNMVKPGDWDRSAGMDALKQENQKLREQISHTVKEMESLQSTEPFTMQSQLEDPEWIASRRRELEARALELRERAKALMIYFQSLTDERLV